MKKLFCMLCCAMLALSAVNCALAAEAGELATATSLKAYLPTVGWDDYTATDADGDGPSIIQSLFCTFRLLSTHILSNKSRHGLHKSG